MVEIQPSITNFRSDTIVGPGKTISLGRHSLSTVSGVPLLQHFHENLLNGSIPWTETSSEQEWELDSLPTPLIIIDSFGNPVKIENLRVSFQIKLKHYLGDLCLLESAKGLVDQISNSINLVFNIRDLANWRENFTEYENPQDFSAPNTLQIKGIAHPKATYLVDSVKFQNPRPI